MAAPEWGPCHIAYNHRVIRDTSYVEYDIDITSLFSPSNHEGPPGPENMGFSLRDDELGLARRSTFLFHHILRGVRRHGLVGEILRPAGRSHRHRSGLLRSVPHVHPWRLHLRHDQEADHQQLCLRWFVFYCAFKQCNGN